MRASAGHLRTALVLGALVIARPIFAQEPPVHPGHPSAAAGEAEEDEVEHANEIALVLAGTTYVEEEVERSHFTLGVEYERRIGRRFGLGLAAEYVTGNEAILVVGTLEFRPVPAFKLFAGPGFESNEVDEEHGEGEREATFLFRVGAGYSFELGHRYSLTPFVAFDILAEEGGARAWVYGVTVGAGF